MNKGLIFDIRRFSVHDGPGIRTTVFFKGCPLRCWWCHNPEGQDFKSEQSIRKHLLSGEKFERSETTGRFMTAEEVVDEVMRDREFYEESGGGVTLSGGEPLIQESFLIELLSVFNNNGIHTTLDTCGYASQQSMINVARWVDLFLYDLKLMDEMMHFNYTGISNRLILENLKVLVGLGKRIILRIPVIPGITDTPDNLEKISGLISGLGSKENILEIDLLPYHSAAKEKYLKFNKRNKLVNLHSMTRDDLVPVKMALEPIGLLVKIGG
ncbi:MAG: glycyl-radical enzyme activating protein [bacterium]